MREEDCMERQEEIKNMIEKLERWNNKFLSQNTQDHIKEAIKILNELYKNFEF